MLKLENFTLRQRMYLIGLMASLFLLGLLVLSQVLAASSTQSILVLGYTVLSIAVLMGFAHWVGRFGDQRAQTLVQALEQIRQGNLSHKVIIHGRSDFSWMAHELNQARENIAGLVHTVIASVEQLNDATQNLVMISHSTVTDQLKQQRETAQVGSAIKAMTGAVQAVASSTADAAHAARNADQEAAQGKTVVVQAMQSIDTLASEVENAAETLSHLESDIGNIVAIVDVIRAITEQTNLLALNAAIEAARAGEHGRGFAVVADEVRTLAARTQSSTHEIEEMVERLQMGARTAVKVMNESREKARNSVEHAASASQSIDRVSSMISTMEQMTQQISMATQEQSVVAQDINQGISTIQQLVDHSAHDSQSLSQAVEALSNLSAQVQQVLAKFRV